MKNIITFLIIAIMLTTLSTSTISQTIHQTTDDFTLTYKDTSYGFSIDYLEDTYQPVTGYGGRLNQIGNTAGPFEYTGVPVTVLADDFSGLSGEFTMVTISSDGYVVHYTHDEINGEVTVYTADGSIVENKEVTMILAYMEEGMKGFSGGPLRIAFVGDDGQYTDSFLWSKDIIEIEFLDESDDMTRPTVDLSSPEDAIYLFDQRLISYSKPFIIGDITIKASITDTNDIGKVIFTVEPDDGPSHIKTRRSQPYQWEFTEQALGSHTIIITAYDTAGNIGQIEKTVFLFNPF